MNAVGLAPAMSVPRFVSLLRFVVVVVFALALPRAATAEETDPWPDLAQQIFPGVVLRDGTGIVTLDAPARAEDAAIVPITMSVSLPGGNTRRLVSLTLVIDQNPSPLAGVFKVGAAATLVSLSTRVRVNAYTNVHLVAELSDGGFYVTQRFVKAAGGCSAPMVKDPQEAKASMGQIRLRQFPAAPGVVGAAESRDVLVMIRHPNNSGMQMDQLSHLYIPPLFVEHLTVAQGGELIFSMEGGISISEDPNFRFSYRLASSADFSVEAIDSDKHEYQRAFPGKPQT